MRSPTSSDVAELEAPVAPGAGVAADLVEAERSFTGWLARSWATEPWRVVRWVGVALHVGAFVYQFTRGMPWTSKGLPTEREQVIGWLLVGSVVWSLGRDRREILLAIGGWGLLGACFVLYDYSRGAIDGWWGNAVGVPGSSRQVPIQSVRNADRVLTAERALFFGHVPTEWLQTHLWRPVASGSRTEGIPRWEVLTAFTYLSHFVVVYVVALVQWVRDKARWFAWIRALATLTVFGVIGYLMFPTAPPWLAERYGLMGSVERPSTRGLRLVGFETAERVWGDKSWSVNIVAAMPSLHFGFTTLVLFYFWRTAPRWARGVLVAYPSLMLFTLVYGGEHYVLDCLAGGLLAWLAVWVNRRVDTWRAAHRPALTAAGSPPDQFSS